MHNTSLSVLAIVALIALTTGANVEEYGSGALKRLYALLKAKITKHNASFINKEFGLELHNPLVLDEDTLVFAAKSIPNQVHARDDTECRKFHGLNMPDLGEIHCRVNCFGFKVTQSGTKGKHLVEIVMMLKDPEAPIGILLDVPLMKRPERRFRNHQELEEWAGSSQVGVTFPMGVEDLEEIRRGKKITIDDFCWLDKVLEFNLREMGDFDPAVVGYLTRPILLPKDVLDKIVEVTEHFINQKKSSSTEEAEGSK